MENTPQPNNTPALMLCPAFYVENGVVTQVNHSASILGILIDTSVDTLIHIGLEEFSQFTEGRLDLTLLLDDVPISACVIPCGKGFTFCLDSDFSRPEQRALALAAQHLKEPLSDALYCTNEIPGDLPAAELDRYSRIRKSLQQMMRMLYNMSDLAGYRSNAELCKRNAVAIFQEILEKAQTLLEKSGKKLVYNLPHRSVLCNMDEQMIRRAVLNLLSNATIFSEDNSPIKADLVLSRGKLYFSVENICQKPFNLTEDLYSRYMREPALENSKSGIGLGLPVVNAVASAHDGAVLMTQPEENSLRITMTISAKDSPAVALHNAIHIPIDRAGGWDETLMELSGVLPAELFKP